MVDTSIFKPTVVNTIAQVIVAAPVVYSICLIWAYKSVPAAIGASIVVSDRGESLSPKTAPLITAPAAISSGTPNAIAIPIIATPAVPALPKEVPVKVEITAVTKKAVTNKNCGSIILIP